MSNENVKPFDGVSIITTDQDAEEVEHLLGLRGDSMLVCPFCGSNRFITKAFVDAEVEILCGERTLITAIENKEISVNRVLKCSHCHRSTDFITVRRVADEENGDSTGNSGAKGQKSNAVGGQAEPGETTGTA